MKCFIAILLAYIVSASSPGTIILPSPGSCITQLGSVSVLPTCFNTGVSKTWIVEPACCSRNLVSQLAINTSVFAPSGDCCKRCVGQGDQHAEDSYGNQVTLGPCLAQPPGSCNRLESLCNPSMCEWRGNIGAFSCEYTGVSPQIQLFAIGDYSFNFTLGLKNSVQTMTAVLGDSALGTINADNCNSFTILGTRTGFSVTNKVQSQAVVWTVVDAQTESQVQITCSTSGQYVGEIGYSVAVRGTDFTGFCKNSVTNDPLVNSWIKRKKCPAAPLPSTLTKPSSYSFNYQNILWSNLPSSLPACTSGWLLTWPGEYESQQVVAIADGTTVEEAPNSLQAPGLYKKLQVSWVKIKPRLHWDRYIFMLISSIYRTFRSSN